VSVNGKQFHVADAGGYSRLVQLIDWLETVEACREGYAAMQRGEGLPLDEAFAELRRVNGLPD
jgi:hypothetical protein